jgi:hypothetical protein
MNTKLYPNVFVQLSLSSTAKFIELRQLNAMYLPSDFNNSDNTRAQVFKDALNELHRQTGLIPEEVEWATDHEYFDPTFQIRFEWQTWVFVPPTKKWELPTYLCETFV